MNKPSKFHHAHARYWDSVERALVDQYHRTEDVASEWAADKMNELAGAAGHAVIPDTLAERLAQEIFMERAE